MFTHFASLVSQSIYMNRIRYLYGTEKKKREEEPLFSFCCFHDLKNLQNHMKGWDRVDS